MGEKSQRRRSQSQIQICEKILKKSKKIGKY
jgi:hypothetical protein